MVQVKHLPQTDHSYWLVDKGLEFELDCAALL
jgi:hypothetical protein